MTYEEFLRDIDKYVGKVVEFVGRFKVSGKTHRFQRYVWDNKEFGPLRPDSLTEILNVRVVRDGKTDASIPGITRVR